MTCRDALLACSAALVVLGLAVAPGGPLRSLVASALAAEPTDSVTIPDDTYGEGGTRQSVSNGKHEVVGEVWRDKNGIVREQFQVAGGGEQLWGFFNGDGTGQPSDWRRSLIAIRPMERPAGRWEMWVVGVDDTPIKEWSTLTRAELDTEFTQWRAQLRIWVNTARRRQQGETG